VGGGMNTLRCSSNHGRPKREKQMVPSTDNTVSMPRMSASNRPCCQKAAVCSQCRHGRVCEEDGRRGSQQKGEKRALTNGCKSTIPDGVTVIGGSSAWLIVGYAPPGPSVHDQSNKCFRAWVAGPRMAGGIGRRSVQCSERYWTAFSSGCGAKAADMEGRGWDRVTKTTG
jgi:hypothetical protein